MARQIHELPAWPAFRWDRAALVEPLAAARHRQGRLIGQMEAMRLGDRGEAVLRTLTDDVVKSSEIEGEVLDSESVRSSVARRLGLDVAGLLPPDRIIDGVVEMLLDATQSYASPLTDERLFRWHALLFPSARSGLRQIASGAWRDDRSGPMQVVSGPYGRERVHFTAPAARRIPDEMAAFLGWFNSGHDDDPVLVAAVAHLWFVTIHPFDDGNGRIARAIADMQLARSEKSPHRFYSMSSQIRRERSAYYAVLESTQKGDLDITRWLSWFIDCLSKSIAHSEHSLANVMRKARFWERHPDTTMNLRQRDMLNRILAGFEGKVTASKWARLEKCSTDTALRDITDLLARGILVRDAAGGRSTSYSLATDEN